MCILDLKIQNVSFNKKNNLGMQQFCIQSCNVDPYIRVLDNTKMQSSNSFEGNR